MKPAAQAESPCHRQKRSASQPKYRHVVHRAVVLGPLVTERTVTVRTFPTAWIAPTASA
jgi:hypothetical protein